MSTPEDRVGFETRQATIVSESMPARELINFARIRQGEPEITEVLIGTCIANLVAVHEGYGSPEELRAYTAALAKIVSPSWPRLV